MVQNMPIDIAAELRAFESDEFETTGSRPYCQWFNDEHDGGLLIKFDDAMAIDLDTDLAEGHGYRCIERVFGYEEDAEPVECLVTDKPILCVLRKGELRMYERAASGEIGDYIGPFQSGAYDSEKHVVKTRYLVHLLVMAEAGYTLLNTEPLLMTLKGTVGAQFGSRGGPLDTLEAAIRRFHGKGGKAVCHPSLLHSI